MTDSKDGFKPPCMLSGANSNIYNLLGLASRALRDHGMHDKAAEMSKRVQSAKSYEEAQFIIWEYVDVS